MLIVALHSWATAALVSPSGPTVVHFPEGCSSCCSCVGIIGGRREAGVFVAAVALAWLA